MCSLIVIVRALLSYPGYGSVSVVRISCGWHISIGKPAYNNPKQHLVVSEPSLARNPVEISQLGMASSGSEYVPT